jgi:hypothetical protein
MATAFDHMTPFQRLSYWLHQRIGELKEEVRILSAEKRMWLEPEIARIIVVPVMRVMELDAQIMALSLEFRQWQNMLEEIGSCDYCNGSGQIREIIAQDESRLQTCSVCNGTGKTVQTQGA